MTDTRRPRRRCPHCGHRSQVDHDPRALREARIRAELKQEDVAKKLGISQSTLSEAENGKASLRAELRTRIAQLYGCDPVTFKTLKAAA